MGKHKLQTQNSHYNWSLFLPYLHQHGPVYSAIDRGNQTSTGGCTAVKVKLQGADEWLPPTPGHVPIFIGLAYTLISCKAELSET